MEGLFLDLKENSYGVCSCTGEIGRVLVVFPRREVWGGRKGVFLSG